MENLYQIMHKHRTLRLKVPNSHTNIYFRTRDKVWCVRVGIIGYGWFAIDKELHRAMERANYYIENVLLPKQNKEKKS